MQPWFKLYFNLCSGAYPLDEYPRILIDISGITNLKNCYFDQNLVIGAGTTLSELMDLFEKLVDVEYFKYLKVLNEHLKLVAHIPVKNVSSELLVISE